jgi:Pyridoxamine 5'-phosphate oxidase
MTVFTEAELHYLRQEQRLGRLATVGRDGMPHIAPVGWRLDPDADTVVITGRDFAPPRSSGTWRPPDGRPSSSTTCSPPGNPEVSRSADGPRRSTGPSRTSGSGRPAL